MGLEEVRDDIIEEAEQEAEGIISKAEREAEEIREDALERAESLEKTRKADFEKEAERKKRKKESDARLENKRKKTALKGELVQKAREQLEKKVEELPTDEEASLVRKGLNSLLQRTELEKAVVSEEVAERISDDFDFEVVQGEIRGFKAEEKGRAVSHNLSFGRMAEETFENNVNRVSDRIFK